MTARYNEFEPFAAQWLRNLIAAGHIAPGHVDDRSILDVSPDDLRGHKQVHLFAGIGVWSHALRCAGWPDDRPVWTASFPCQPFSAAGQRKGVDDHRHLWPVGFDLIRECRPPVILGEQVASPDGLGWWDAVQADLEGEDYACAAFDLCAPGIGAPHIRQRLYWVAYAHDEGLEGRRQPGRERAVEWPVGAGVLAGGLVDADRQSARRDGGGAHRAEVAVDGPHPRDDHGPWDAGETGGLVDADRAGLLAGQRHDPAAGYGASPTPAGEFGRLADADGVHRPEVVAGDDAFDEQRASVRRRAEQPAGVGADGGDRGGNHRPGCGGIGLAGDVAGMARPGQTNGFWRDVDWLGCRDGKWRPVEPGTFPLAHGAPARVGRLRAYGNAVAAPLAQGFIEAVQDTLYPAVDLRLIDEDVFA